jgi:hypothetical protein
LVDVWGLWVGVFPVGDGGDGLYFVGVVWCGEVKVDITVKGVYAPHTVHSDEVKRFKKELLHLIQRYGWSAWETDILIDYGQDD